MAETFGVPIQTKKFTTTDGSPYFHWHLQRDSRWGHVSILNPFQGVLVIGGAGSGKSYTVAEELIDQGIAQGFTGFIYDFKFPVLTKEVHAAFIRHVDPDKDKRKLYIVNFRDMTKTHRINPINPAYIKMNTMAKELATAFAINLNKEWIQKQDFWYQSAVNVFAGLILYLRNKSIDGGPRGEFCTIPHLVEFLLINQKAIVEILRRDSDSKAFISALDSAMRNNAESQIGGVMGSIQNPIAQLRNKEMYWVLSGNDVHLDLNDPENPAVLCVANDPEMQDANAPVISLIGTCVTKRINVQKRLPSLFLLDEGPTIYVPNLQNLPATARSNKVATIYMAQDYAQIRSQYGADNQQALTANLGNKFFGMVGDMKTAKEVSEMIGKGEKVMESTSTSSSSGQSSSSSRSKSYSKQEKLLVPPELVGQLSAGEFVGKVTTPQKGMFAFFHGKLEVDHRKDRNKYAFEGFVSPFTNNPDLMDQVLTANMAKIEEDIRRICRAENVNPETGDPM